MARRKRVRRLSQLTQRKLRSRVTNGSVIFQGVDHRSKAVRRLKDLLAAHISDLGGDNNGNMSEAMRCLARRASVLTLQCEFQEQHWQANGGRASADQLEVYGRTVNTLRRCVESLGLNAGRKMRELNPADDVAWQAYQKELRAP